jgi:hypothetical protein
MSEDGEDIDPPTIWAAFQAIELTFDTESIPCRIVFYRDSLNSGMLIILCNLWHLDDKIPHSDGSINQNKWLFPHFPSFSSERNGDTIRCQIHKKWRPHWFHRVSLYRGYCFQIYVSVYWALSLVYLVSPVCISRYLHDCEVLDFRGFAYKYMQRPLPTHYCALLVLVCWP